jgi:glycosyltransferase involved in cell wall biosynthesis
VLVNNNSTDKSDAICREYAARCDKIHYHALTGEPVIGRAAIYGAKEAKGEYLQYIDGDDILPPNVYSEIASILRNVAPDILFGRFNTLLESNIINFVDTPFESERINGCRKSDVLDYLSEKQPLILSLWRLIVSRKLLNYFSLSAQTLETPTNIHQDVYISVRTLVAADSIHYIDKPIYQYRVRSLSVSRVTTSKQVSECFAVLHDLAQIQLGAKTEQEQHFVGIYKEQFRYQLSAALCTLNDEQIVEIGFKLDAYRKNCMNVIERLVEDILSKKGTVYLSPTGNIGLYMKTTLEAKGILLSGFFDNDIQKDGMTVDGVPIHLPDIVTEIKGDTPIAILIAARYENVRKELKKQFISIGIDETDLYIVEF